MKCPDCKGTLKEVKVRVHGADHPVTSRQCTSCDYFSFDQEDAAQALDELRSPLRLRQTVVKLSADRLGMYFSKDIVRSIGLKKGERLNVSVPDEKHILLERQ